MRRPLEPRSITVHTDARSTFTLTTYFNGTRIFCVLQHRIDSGPLQVLYDTHTIATQKRPKKDGQAALDRLHRMNRDIGMSLVEQHLAICPFPKP